MNNPFEQIEKSISDLSNNVLLLATEIKSEKRWLNIKEVANYLGYSTHQIHKLKGEEFVSGVHYYKRSGKLLFDKYMVDKWVLGLDVKNSHNAIDIKSKVNTILDGLVKS